TDVVGDFMLVELLEFGMHGHVEAFEIARRRIRHDLIGASCTGDDCRHGIEIEAEPHRELSHRPPRRYQWSQSFDELKPGPKLQTGECFADIERVSIPVEIAVIVRGKGRL